MAESFVSSAVISRVQRREALVQRPPFGGSLPLPLILAMKKRAIPLAGHAPWQAVGCGAVHSAFTGSGLPVEGGMALVCI